VPAGEPMSPTRNITDDELLQLPKDGNKYEVVDGELVVSPGAGFRHENIMGELFTRLRTFAKERGLGLVMPSNLLYVLPSGNRRGPDISFIAADRVAALAPDTVFPRLAPDLAVEVLSPSDSLPRMLAKVAEYLDSGTRLVWVIDPENRRAAACRAITAIREIGPDGELDGEDVLPGFRCRLSDILD
jgi:Uma2 family endonuclease